jgi:predicted Rossmann fold flavoprotein
VDGDVLIVGAGAAGLATAIFLARLAPARSILLVDGAKRPGAKILVSGGGRCNVTNVRVTEGDFNGGSRAVVRQVLRALTVPDTVAFFRELGVSLHEEANGKLFPDTNRARDVVDALLGECDRLGVRRRDSCRVTAIQWDGDRASLDRSTSDPDRAAFAADSSIGRITARRLVLATGGRSLPKSGSDGAGWTFAQRFGHTIVAPVPALVPLMLDPANRLSHAALAGVSHDAEIAVWIDRRVAVRVTGSMLWTHFGISGPVALDASRHWTRAADEGRHVHLTLSCRPATGFEAMDADLRQLIAARPRASIQALLTEFVPASVGAAVGAAAGIGPDMVASMLSRTARREMAHLLVELPLPVIGTRGYNYAEVTAGGVALSEVQARTLESRRRPDLFFVGEILDVDGRLGGFNFQWAWSSAMTVARAIAQAR